MKLSPQTDKKLMYKKHTHNVGKGKGKAFPLQAYGAQSVLGG
jgi:hypothetical protein